MRNTGHGSHGQEANVGHSAAQVFYADGEKISTVTVQAALRQLDVKVTHFEVVENCLDSLRTRGCHLLISNPRQPAVEGMELLLGAKRIMPSVPVVLLVDHGDIPTAVCAMKSGAADCLERPLERERLVSAIHLALRRSAQDNPPRRASLSKTESQVLRHILQGHTTAETARRLHRSRRTVEVHRSHIMRKLEVGSMVDLVRRCGQMGLLEDWP